MTQFPVQNGLAFIPQGTTIINDRAFLGCQDLTTVIIPEGVTTKDLKTLKLSSLDQWLINRLEDTISKVTYNMERYDFNAASGYLYNFVYDDFCSQYLEMSLIISSVNSFSFICKISQIESAVIIIPQFV